MNDGVLTGLIIECAMKVHSKLGPGLLESVYEACLAYELQEKNLDVRRQCALPIKYGKLNIEAGYRIDLLVENKVIVELKSVEKYQPIHKAQLLSYLKLSDKRLGLLINFNVVHLREGIKRLAN